MAQDILLQLRVPPEINDKIRLKLERLLKTHQQDMEDLEKDMRACDTEARAEKLQARFDALHQRSRKITSHNVVRMALYLGIRDMKDAREALDYIEETGVAIGRPRRVQG
jgi:transcriptional regulator of NAD metabolism